MNRYILPLFLSITLASSAKCSEIVCSEKDSIEVERLLAEACSKFGSGQTDRGQLMVFFARKFIGRPYLAHTLEKKGKESLIVNTAEFDCTTLVETATALSMAYYKGKHFRDFLVALKSIRYRSGVINGYPSRLHYFSWWISDNVKRGNVRDVGKDEESPFIGKKRLSLHFMSSNPNYYENLKNNAENFRLIKAFESQSNGTIVNYIPKDSLNRPEGELPVRDGDVIALVTSKEGLDISHVGIAVWKGKSLHLINASSLAHKVIISKESIFLYEKKRPSLLGIRVIRLC